MCITGPGDLQTNGNVTFEECTSSENQVCTFIFIYKECDHICIGSSL